MTFHGNGTEYNTMQSDRRAGRQIERHLQADREEEDRREEKGQHRSITVNNVWNSLIGSIRNYFQRKKCSYLLSAAGFRR